MFCTWTEEGKWLQYSEPPPPAKATPLSLITAPSVHRTGHWMFCHWSFLCECYWYLSLLVPWPFFGGAGSSCSPGEPLVTGVQLTESHAFGLGRVDVVGGGRGRFCHHRGMVPPHRLASSRSRLPSKDGTGKGSFRPGLCCVTSRMHRLILTESSEGTDSGPREPQLSPPPPPQGCRLGSRFEP